jgi:site-specific DNA-methyltransferase (adenine-specific)
MEDNSVDAIITDPPYGINYQSRRVAKSNRVAPIQNDEGVWLGWIPDAYRVLSSGGCGIVFCRWDVEEQFANALRSAGFSIHSQVIWDREVTGMADVQTCFAPQHDNAWFVSKGRFEFPSKRPASVIRVKRVSNKVHPTQKPVALMYYLVDRLTTKGAIVFDPFMGSGTTGIACHNLGRNFIGCEIDKGYFEIAKDRIEAVQAQERLL